MLQIYGRRTAAFFEVMLKCFRTYLFRHDNVNRSSRLLVFASNSGLEALGLADRWFIDGTFKIAPEGFKQVLAIRVYINGASVTGAYALLPSKKRVAYTETFIALKVEMVDTGIMPVVRSIMADFEPALRNAVTEVFGQDLHQKACFFPPPKRLNSSCS